MTQALQGQVYLDYPNIARGLQGLTLQGLADPVLSGIKSGSTTCKVVYVVHCCTISVPFIPCHCSKTEFQSGKSPQAPLHLSSGSETQNIHRTLTPALNIGGLGSCGQIHTTLG